MIDALKALLMNDATDPEGLVAGIVVAASLLWVFVRSMNQRHDQREWWKRKRPADDTR
jgi:hypothetical protein